jgi:hypothetical protein
MHRKTGVREVVRDRLNIPVVIRTYLSQIQVYLETGLTLGNASRVPAQVFLK